MDIKEKEELIRLLSKYQEETMEKVKKWGSLVSCPFIEKMNTIAKVGCYLSLEIAESMKRQKDVSENCTVQQSKRCIGLC